MPKELAKRKAAGVDNTNRRTWDVDEYADKAATREAEEKRVEESALDAKKRRRLERDPLHQGLIVERSKLQQRNYTLDLKARLGKTQVVTNTTPINQQAGYFCNVCDCILRDSASYLDHINGKYHNRALGMSMRVEKSTVDDVRTRLEKLKEGREQAPEMDSVADGWEHKVEEAKREEESRRQRKLQQKALKAVESEDEEEEMDPEMAAMMGFGGFGTTKQ